jgi:hypothetical protein
VAEAQQPPEAPNPPPPSPPARPAPLAAALPYLATAVAAVVASLLIQSLLWPRPLAVAPATPPAPAAPPSTQTPAASVTPAPGAATPAPGPSPAQTPGRPTPAPADEALLRLEILDLEAADRRLWSALYLLRAATQIDDAIVALQGNDLAEADRTLLTAYRSLDRAYAVSAESDKGPIDTFRMQLSRIRDDLSIRPEGADRRLRQLRQLMLSLVDEGS